MHATIMATPLTQPNAIPIIWSLVRPPPEVLVVEFPGGSTVVVPVDVKDVDVVEVLRSDDVNSSDVDIDVAMLERPPGAAAVAELIY